MRRPAPSLLTPAQAPKAQAIIDEIARALVRVDPPVDGDLDVMTSLLTREPGLTIFYAYLDRAQPRAAWRRSGIRHLERAIARVPNMSYKPFFSYGFSGTAWAVQHLSRWFLDVPAGMNADVDDALLTLVEEAPTLSYDIQFGLAGFGIYAVERLPYPKARRTLEGIVQRLEQTAEPRGGGLAWRTVNADWVEGAGVAEALAKGVYDCSVFNGAGGVVGLLGAAIRHGVAEKRARRLLDGALTWMWSRRRQGLFVTSTQLGWEHGSLGIATVAFVAARAAGLDKWQREALAVARRLATAEGAAARLPNPSLGSGAAGAAHMFRRLHEATGDDLFARAAQQWTRRLLQRRKPGRGIAGYATAYSPAWQRKYLNDPDYPIGWIALPGIDNGVAGIGLVLLSMLHAAPPDWDRMMLLSHR